MRETCITRIEDDKKVCIYTSERKYINTIYRLQNSHPEEVNITKVNSDGSINAEVPYDWLVFPRPKSSSGRPDRLPRAFCRIRPLPGP